MWESLEVVVAVYAGAVHHRDLPEDLTMTEHTNKPTVIQTLSSSTAAVIYSHRQA